MSSKKKIVIASGDPAGCGPLITLKAVQSLQNRNITFFLVGDRKVFVKLSGYRKLGKTVNFIDVNTRGIEKLKKGCASLLSGQAALSYLNEALELIKAERIKTLVTAPLSKEAVQLIDKKFSGHTEYLRDYFKAPQVAMMMVSPLMKVVLLTRHQPLRKVAYTLSRKTIQDTFNLVHSWLKLKFKIKRPQIAFSSVNPHAGLDTFLEREEKKMVSVISKFSGKAYGPYPADSLFTGQNLNKYDCIICAYHDQAMIPFKLLSMKQGVNLTLGLPIIRTSPAHGVAYDLIRQKKTPFHSSMLAAIKLALDLT